MDSQFSNFVFFQLINDFLLDELDIFQWQLLQRTSLWVGSVALILLTLWILFQGYRLAAGRSGEPMMALVGDALRAVLIIGLATSMATGGSQLYWRLTDGLAETLNRVVTGQDESPFKSIDRNMAVMQGSLTLIDALNTGGDAEVENAKTQAQWFTGIGTAGPALVAGSALLLNKIAVALFLSFGPLFILCLLFKKTEPMFGRWLFYGLGTFFSLSVLSVMAGLAMKMIGAISMAFVARQLAVQSGVLTVTDGEGISSLAMQQGGIGLLLSVLLMMTPVMAARFFNGLLGQFAAFNAFGRVGAGNARQRPPHAAPPHHGGDDGPSPDHLPPLHTRGAESAQHLDVIKRQPSSEPTNGDGDFLERYPHALASNDWIGGLRSTRTGVENMPPAIDHALPGINEDAIPISVVREADLANLKVSIGQVTFDAEGNDVHGSKYYSRQLHWPGGESGITIGRGYDMRYRTRASVLTDLLVSGMKKEVAERFADGAGLSHQNAKAFVDQHRHEYGEISRRLQRRLFEDFVYPRYVEDAKRRYESYVATTPNAPSWDDLDTRVKDVAIDLTYQQGSVYRRQMPFIAENNRDSLARYIESTPELSQYEGGRHRVKYLRSD